MDKLKTIIEYREKGLSYQEIAKEVGCSKSLVALYCNSEYQEKIKRKKIEQMEYERVICQLIKESDNINQVCKKIWKRPTNTNYSSIKKIISKYNIDTSHFTAGNKGTKIIRYIDDEVYCENSPYTNSNSLKKRLIKTGKKEEKCEYCGLTHWNNIPIPLELHHINGKHNDNRIENLLLICPNCHATTENYCGRNKKRKEKTVVRNVIEANYDEEIALIIKYAKEKCNFTYIAKQMGLTDNGVRKRCKKIGLPYRTNELKLYIENLDI